MWLLKTEPGSYGYDDLEREGRTVWDGVTNPAALAGMRRMSRGERVLIYHTGAEKAVVGLARVAREAFADPARAGGGRVVVEIEAEGRLARPVPLAELKGCAVFKDSPLVRQGRLSVVRLTEAQWMEIERLSSRRGSR
jgi:predicted RNA-binding protein with PUA-like domain